MIKRIFFYSVAFKEKGPKQSFAAATAAMPVWIWVTKANQL